MNQRNRELFSLSVPLIPVPTGMELTPKQRREAALLRRREGSGGFGVPVVTRHIRDHLRGILPNDIASGRAVNGRLVAPPQLPQPDLNLMGSARTGFVK